MHTSTTRDVANTHRVREGGFELRRRGSGAVLSDPSGCMFPQVGWMIASADVRPTPWPSAGTCDQSCDHFAETALGSCAGQPPVPHPRRTGSFSTPGGGEDRGRRTSLGDRRPASFRAPVRAGSRARHHRVISDIAQEPATERDGTHPHSRCASELVSRSRSLGVVARRRGPPPNHARSAVIAKLHLLARSWDVDGACQTAGQGHLE
jgi:hypothetical protein